MTSTRVYRGTPRNIALLAARLRAGELVAVPTETVYGLAANALDPRACAKIFKVKGRPTTDPLIVHIHSLRQLALPSRPNPIALELARAFWPGPLTMVLPKTEIVPDIVTAGRDSVAVRMPKHALFRRLLKAAAVPLAAPSANPFGYISPTTAAHVHASLAGKIGHILDGGGSRIGLESTIIDVRDPREPVILRPGAITIEEVEAVLGRKVRVHMVHSRSSGAQVAPGQLARHYSPRTPVVLHKRIAAGAQDPREAFVFLGKPPTPMRRNVYWLDPRGDLRGAARRLFAVLRMLDVKGYSKLHVELAPESGLGRAINDRLRRAAAR